MEESQIAIVIKEEGKNSRISIHPERSLTTFQRIYGNLLIDYYLVDEKGERIRDVKPSVAVSREEKGFEALKKVAKDLKIKKWHLMSEATLLKAVQEASK